MRLWLLRLLARAFRWLSPKPDNGPELRAIIKVLGTINPEQAESMRRRWAVEDVLERK